MKKTTTNIEQKLNDTINIDVSLIPNHVKEDLAATILGCVREYKRQPGGAEALQATIKELEAGGRL